MAMEPGGAGASFADRLRRGDKRAWLYVALGIVALVGVIIAARYAASKGQAAIAAQTSAATVPGLTTTEPTITTQTTPITVPIPSPGVSAPPPRPYIPVPIPPPGTPGGPIPIDTGYQPPTLTPPTHTPAPPPAPAPPPPQSFGPVPAPQRTYTVQRGDTLWSIAQRYYGNGALFPRIVAANQAVIQKWSNGNQNLIYPGETFVIP